MNDFYQNSYLYLYKKSEVNMKTVICHSFIAKVIISFQLKMMIDYYFIFILFYLGTVAPPIQDTSFSGGDWAVNMKMKSLCQLFRIASSK